MLMNLKPHEYRTLLRRDLYAFTERCFYELYPTTEFLPNWHIEVGAARLQACQRGEIHRLILNQPPRSLKSLLASVAFVAFRDRDHGHRGPYRGRGGQARGIAMVRPRVAHGGCRYV